MKEWMDLQRQMRELLPKKRYAHTLGVAYTSACLAMRYGADPDKAQTAGLLHDCAKYLTEKELLKEGKRLGLTVSEAERKAPQLLHGKVGACYARDRYGIEEEDILSAIRYHTTGRPNMSLLEQIVFVADYMEPGRKPNPGLAEIRREAFVDLDRTTLLILSNTLAYLEESTADIDSRTVETLHYYQQKGEEYGTVKGNGKIGL